MKRESTISLGAYSVRLSVCASSDIGTTRDLNEDSYLAGPPVFVVADGMGGHAHGDRASAEVVRVFSERYRQEPATTPAHVLESIAQANSAVRALTPDDREGDEIAGTTLTGVALVTSGTDDSPSWMVVNIGDSRTYSWVGDSLAQVTVDHSAVQDLVDSGQITPAEAETHPERNIVTRAIGVDDEPEADVWLIPAGGSQLFILCSDGLTKELSDARIADIIRDSADPFASDSLAERLVSAAVAAGGRDNVTVVAVGSVWSVGEAGGPSPMPAFLEETAPRT